jgi:hypothetical protein
MVYAGNDACKDFTDQYQRIFPMQNKMALMAAMAALMSAPLLSAPAYAADGASHMAMQASTQAVATTTSVKLAATKDVLRDLWLEHVFWIRAVDVATISGNKDAAKVAEAQVVANAHALADAFEPFYGAGAKDALFKLLAGHYAAVKDYLDASVAKDETKEKAATNAMFTNAEAIAAFLNKANPNWPKDVVLNLLQVHAGHHVKQIQQLVAKDYKGEAQTWAAMTQHMYVIADALADGLAKQFPDKF